MIPDNFRIPLEIADRIVDPKEHGNGGLFQTSSWLRANQPLGWAEPSNTDPFWAVSRQEDIRAISMDNSLFLNGERNITLVNREEERRMRALTGGRPSPVRMIINMDLPDHPKYRAVAAPYFRPSSLDVLETKIRAIANESIDHMAALGNECDFAEDVAFLYPLRVVMAVLGVPRSEEAFMLRLTQELVGANDPDQARGGVVKTGAEAAEELMALAAEIGNFFGAKLADRRINPQDDLISIIANSQIDGAPMPELEARSYCHVAATAGHDTTSASSAGGIWGLAENPGEFAKVAADRSLIAGLVEEAVRWTSPSKITMRAAARDAELCGRSFKKGDWIGLMWASANRDEAVFTDPFSFKVDRKPNRQLGFGWGAHNCIGQHLARMEMRILFEEFFKRVAHVELNGTPATVASLMVSGPKRVPIRFKMH